MGSSELSNPEIVMTAPRTVELREGEIVPLPPGGIRVRSTRSLISAGTEGSAYIGREWQRPDGRTMPQYPYCPGYSCVGVVVEVGEDVEGFALGDRVTTPGSHRLLNVFGPAQPVWHIPDGVGDEEATFCVLGCTVLNGVRMGHPQLGESAVVVGLGVLGQLACRYLSLTGARPIVGIDLDDYRLDLAMEAGAVTHALNPSECDARGEVEALTGGRGADVVFEVTGRTETYDMAFDLARRFGTVVALGSPRWPAPVDMMKLHLKALNCVGAIVSAHPQPGDERSRWSRPANGELFLELAAEGHLALEPMITHRFAWDRAAEAYPQAIGEREPGLAVILQWPD